MTKTSHHKVSAFKLLLPSYALLIIVFAVLIHNGTMQVLMPSGTIADFQSKILWGALIFALVVGCTIIGSFFFVAGGLVIDIGGAMSHGAIIAREIGVPCVINTRVGTKCFKTGDRVIVDGDNGVVQLASHTQ